MNHYNIELNKNTDRICIPGEETIDIAKIRCSNDITDVQEIKNVIQTVKKLHPHVITCVNCAIMQNLPELLPDIECLTLRLTSTDDFQAFLEMDNHLTPEETKGKDLMLLVNDAVEIDGCKPEELPLMWSVMKIPQTV